jgi:integrase/recombinase XerD
MTALAPTLQAFFTDRLTRQRNASPHTIAGYRDTWRMLLTFAAARTGIAPSMLDLDDVDAPLIAAFLDHLENDRGNSVRTRNTRLAAIHSLFRYAALAHPEHAQSISRVLALPPKRFDRALICYLTEPEVEALLATCDQTSWTGRRDHAMLLLAVQTGLRISELIGLTRAVLRDWLGEHLAEPTAPLFPSRHGRPLSRDAIERRIGHYAALAAQGCPSLHEKTITAHVLRHTTAMRLLHAGVDTSVIALWLGHVSIDTTQIYLHADMTLKEQALARTRPANSRHGRYQPPDTLIAWLEGL